MPVHLNTRNIFFIRHGQSESNTHTELAAGPNYDSPLTELGKQQAKELGKRFKNENITFDLLFTSELSRAIETSEIFLASSSNDEIKIKRSKQLNELQIPGWRGKKRVEVMTPEVEILWGKNGKLYSPDDGESEYEVQKRFSNYIDQEILFKTEVQNINRRINIAVVTHGWALRCYFQYILEFDQSYIRKMQMDNTSITQFKFNSEGWRLIRLNDSSHLDKLDKETARYK
ncbi:MAG: hypothetical protein CL899_03915 [Dehalococcoidia bacterium]|nr:hypothetical protein [Dehalococcoidia bacterium]|tara:strand:- start:823 stop:1512 length:690 start_codon:yes stop_codon:yes gene_type:complete